MAGEIQMPHTETGRTLYALVRSATATIWKTTTSALVTYATADRADYDIALTEQGTASRHYVGDFPAAAAGVYYISIHDRLGGSPAETDPLVGQGRLDWNGSAVVAAGTLNANSVSAAVLANDAALEIADELLKRNVSNVEATAPEHSLATVILALLEFSISGTTLTIKRTDGSTTHFTKTLTSSPGADPITGLT